jgi:hypothetical protein
MKYLALLSSLLFLISCGPSHKDVEVQQLYDKVMEVHDEVMPKMSDINKLKKRIRKLETDDPAALALLKDLDDADEGMMSWMADFQKYKTLKDSSKTAKLAYLNSEKVRIQNVSDKMKQSISAAQNYLNE